MGLAAAAAAETVYIRDSLYVPLRGGQSSEHRILHRGIRSGTALELIRHNEETGYSLVRMEDGLEGWLQTQYLVDEPVASTVLEDTERELLDLEAEHQQALLRIQELEEENAGLTEELAALGERHADTTKELAEIRALAEDTIRIQEQNESLQAEREALNQQIDALMIANDKLQNDSAQEWFLRGGAVVIIALLMGFWFARRIYHRDAAIWS